MQRILRDLLKRLFFENGESNWVDILPAIKKQYNNRIHSSTKSTPIRASLKKNEGYFYPNFLDKRKNKKTKISSKQSRQDSRFEGNVFEIRFDKLVS